MNQSQLADRSGVDPAIISRVMTGKTDLVSESLFKLAVALDATPAQLLATDLVVSNVGPATIGSHRIPLLSWSEIGSFKGPPPYLWNEEQKEFMLTDGEYSGNAFALKIQGDSMAPRFRDGDAIIVDPAVRPKPNEFVVARYNGGTTIFAQYKDRGLHQGTPAFELRPLNDGYASVRSSQTTEIFVIGTVVEHRQYRTK